MASRLSSSLTEDLPFALQQHAEISPVNEATLGDPTQSWNWEPAGTIDRNSLSEYARSTPHTRTNTGGIADRGEYY
jgi:hypothetical protein